MRPWIRALAAVAGAVRLASAQDTDARAIVVSALRAADGGTLPAWTAAWERRLRVRPRDRASVFALATSARLRYRFEDAEHWYTDVQGADTAHDALARQSRLGLALVAVTRGRLAEAMTLASAAEREARDAADSSTWLEATTLRAGLLGQTVSVASAALLIDSAVAVLRPARDPQLEVQYLCQRAQIASARGDRAAARRDAHAGADRARRAGLKRGEAACLFVLVTEFVRAAATDSLAAIVPTLLARERESGARDLLGTTQQWVGWYLLSLGRHEQARRALAEAWTAGQDARSAVIMAWTALARTTLALTFRDLTDASLWLGRADSLMRRTGDRNGTAQVLSRRALLAIESGNTRQAAAIADSALELTTSAGDPQLMLHVLELQRSLALRQDRADESARVLAREADLVKRYAMSGWETMLQSSQIDIDLMRARWSDAESGARTVLARLHPSQHALRHDARVRLALAQIGRGDAAEAEREAMAAADEFDAWRATLADDDFRALAAQARDVDPTDRGMTALIAELARAGRAARAFELAERRRARELGDRMALASAWRASSVTRSVSPNWADPRGVTSAAIVASLPDSETAILEYVTGPGATPTTLFVATRHGVSARLLAPIDSLTMLVQRFLAEVEAGRDGAVTGAALGGRLLGPALADLPFGVRRIVLIPDGVLHRLPFDALRLPDARIVVERYETAVAPSAAIVARFWTTIPATVRTGSSGGARLLAFGDPRFATERDARGDSDADLHREAFGGESGLPRLRASADEVKRVARFAGRSDVRLRERASEAYLASAPLADYDVLHFATHALVDEWSVSRTALALAPGGGEDGFVEPAEIARLDLRARLVVLSGCRTAGGEIVGGEGVRGLVTPFLHAGARSVVATQWAIGDRSVITFIERFYAALAAGDQVSTALWRTKRALLAAGAPPRDWSVFTVVGDPTVRLPARADTR